MWEPLGILVGLGHRWCRTEAAPRSSWGLILPRGLGFLKHCPLPPSGVSVQRGCGRHESRAVGAGRAVALRPAGPLTWHLEMRVWFHQHTPGH